MAEKHAIQIGWLTSSHSSRTNEVLFSTSLAEYSTCLLCADRRHMCRIGDDEKSAVHPRVTHGRV